MKTVINNKLIKQLACHLLWVSSLLGGTYAKASLLIHEKLEDNRPRVLLIEQNDKTARLVKRYLMKKGYCVHHARCPQESEVFLNYSIEVGRPYHFKCNNEVLSLRISGSEMETELDEKVKFLHI